MDEGEDKMGAKPLEREQVEFYRREGFLRAPQFADAAAVQVLLPIYDRLFEARAGYDEGNYFDMVAPETEAAFRTPQMLRLTRYAPELEQSPVFTAGLAIARQLLGPSARLTMDHGILKPARSVEPTPWHQDEAFWDGRYEHEGLSIWIPLQPVDAESGCLHFVPASHRRRVLRHRTIGEDPRVHGLEVPDLAPRLVEVCPLPLGGATIHHVRTLHYSAPNRSDIDRRAYVLVFQGKRRRRLISRPQHWQLTKATARAARAEAVGASG
jgi:hypothetical protein